MRYYVQSSWKDKGSRVGTYYMSLDKAKEAAKKSKQYYVFDQNGKIVWPTHKSAKAKIERAVLWANAVTADKRHGYNNTEGKRWGEDGDYACSSLIITALEQAGIPVKSAGATVTANMKPVFLKVGFKDVTSKVNFKTCEGMQRGDILITPGQHTEMYIGNKRLIGARGNAPSGKPENGVRGDQTGGEIVKSSYYNYPWKICLRYAPVTAKKYRVQLGGFKSRAGAEKLQRDVAKKFKTLKTYISKSGDLYLLRSGSMSKEDGTKLIRELLDAGFTALLK